MHVINWHVLLAMRALLLNLLGALLVFAGVALIAVNARALLHFGTIAAQHGGQVIDLGRDAAPQPAQHGHMVRVVGTPRVVKAARDPQFNLSVDTPVLSRNVEMFEWHEVRVGGRVQYEMDWADHWIDSSRFREPRGHTNPQGFPVQDKRFEAGLVQIGRFHLAPVLQRAMPGAVAVTPEVDMLPANLAASFARHGDYLQTSAQADNPQLGDLRVSWDKAPLRLMTMAARVDGNRLLPAEGAADGQGYQVAIGDVGLRALFPDLPSAPEATGLKRALSVVLAMLGAFVLLSVRRHAIIAPTQAMLRRRLWSDLLLAAGVGALAVGAVAATIWAGHDIHYALWWAGIALLGALLSVWQWHRRD